MPARNLYDEVPYPTAAMRDTHPGNLAVMATLYGMSPPPVSRCRVLEVGCGDGGNLIPMAFNLPEGRFTGIDLAEKPIAHGNRIVAGMGIPNITLEVRDLLSITPEFGEFDYILVHGLYAWVPPVVQDKILDVCNRNLAPGGVAYVSYNSYPGAHLRRMSRDMFQYFVRPLDETPLTREKIGQLLRLTKEARPEAGRWAGVIAQVSTLVDSQNLNAVMHDDLAEHHRPAYFHEFVSHAGRHGLQFLSEATFLSTDDEWLSPGEVEMIGRLDGDPIVNRQQYVDFLKLRTFRQTLLCHKELPLRRDRILDSLLKLQVSSNLLPVSEKPDLTSQKPETFRSYHGATITHDHPAVKSLLALLATCWPRPMRVTDLIQEDAPASAVATLLFGLHSSGALTFHTHWVPFVPRGGERPVSSALSRRQLRVQDYVTSQEHMDVRLKDSLSMSLIQKLDGTRTRAQLLAEISAVDPEVTAQSLEASLTNLGHLALLTG